MTTIEAVRATETRMGAPAIEAPGLGGVSTAAKEARLRAIVDDRWMTLTTSPCFDDTGAANKRLIRLTEGSRDLALRLVWGLVPGRSDEDAMLDRLVDDLDSVIEARVKDFAVELLAMRESQGYAG
jgi:hypothetical protein